MLASTEVHEIKSSENLVEFILLFIVNIIKHSRLAKIDLSIPIFISVSVNMPVRECIDHFIMDKHMKRPHGTLKTI